MPIGQNLASAQILRPYPGPIQTQPRPAAIPKKARAPQPQGPKENEILVRAVTQEVQGTWRYLRGLSHVETTEVLLKADEIDYDEDTHYVEARGNVRFQHFTGGEDIYADKVEYNLKDETGKFYNLKGSSPAKIDARQGVLTSSNPFTFQGKWAERMADRYILHEGFITNCKLPKPWWRLTGPKFDIIPGQRALAYNSYFRLTKYPLFYTPVFYKSLEKFPRRSGFLTPNIGNSSRRGKMVGVGYYWAINRSYDLTYRNQLFTARGFAHHVDFRGKPNDRTDFNTIIYGVNDRGLELGDGTRRKEGGFLVSFTGRSLLGNGFEARTNINYLSSFTFRQAFTESFNEAVFSEVNSIGYVTKQWSTFSLDAVFSRNEIFLSTLPDDKIITRKLPSLEFRSREREIFKNIPIWFSVDSSATFIHRTEPLFQNGQFMDRLDIAPRVMTAFSFMGIRLIPAFGLRETEYGQSRPGGVLSGSSLLRSSRDISLELIPPSLARIFKAPKFMGDKVKHVIEPRASFRYVSGVKDFRDIIRFDDTEILTNTKEAEFSITNRFFAKRGSDVTEVLSWQVWQRRYFDPDFGGAVTNGVRNVVQTTTQLTGYSFLDGARRYSPVVSVARVNPIPQLGVEWRADYDPFRQRFTNSSFTTDARISQYFVSVGHGQVRSSTPLSPQANQILGRAGIGHENRRGWNAGVSAVYNYREGIMQYATTQVSYNSDCCGLSVQYRRFNFVTRNENQFRVAFAIANIGTFGTLKKQERMF